MNIQQILNSIFKRTKRDVNTEKRQRVAADDELRSEINNIRSSLSGYVKRLVVQSLPTSNIDANTIYMILDFNSTKIRNVYNEYLYINNKWELIGTTEASGPIYTAGSNIQISNNVISATYTAGDGINISNGTISVSSLKFTNVSASNWIYDLTYSSYGYFYKCDLACQGVTSSKLMEVIFDVNEATSGDYAPICESGTDKVTIYSKVQQSFTIPVIKEVI